MQQDGSHASFETSLRDQLMAAGDAAQSQDSTAYPSAYPAPTPGQTQGPIDPTIEEEAPRSALEHEHALEGVHESAEHLHMPPRDVAPKKELRKTKRAAQNRAAQRAFRERQSMLMSQLQDRAQRFDDLERNFRYLERQNFIMQTYIVTLQNKLSEYTSDIPPIPDEPGPEFVARPENPEDQNLDGQDQIQHQHGYAALSAEYGDAPPPPPEEDPQTEYAEQQTHRSLVSQLQPPEQEVQPQVQVEPPSAADTTPIVHGLDDIETRVQQQLPDQQVVEALIKGE